MARPNFSEWLKGGVQEEQERVEETLQEDLEVREVIQPPSLEYQNQGDRWNLMSEDVQARARLWEWMEKKEIPFPPIDDWVIGSILIWRETSDGWQYQILGEKR